MATLSFGPFESDVRVLDDGAGDDDFRADALTARFAGRVLEATDEGMALAARDGFPTSLLSSSSLCRL